MENDQSTPRLKLHAILVECLGSENVYHQPPPSFKMQYPCIVYKRGRPEVRFADNLKYRSTKRYEVTVMDFNPDSLIPDKVAALPLCSLEQHFTANNLNHDVFNLFF